MSLDGSCAAYGKPLVVVMMMHVKPATTIHTSTALLVLATMKSRSKTETENEDILVDVPTLVTINSIYLTYGRTHRCAVIIVLIGVAVP